MCRRFERLASNGRRDRYSREYAGSFLLFFFPVFFFFRSFFRGFVRCPRMRAVRPDEYHNTRAVGRPLGPLNNNLHASMLEVVLGRPAPHTECVSHEFRSRVFGCPCWVRVSGPVCYA